VNPQRRSTTTQAGVSYIEVLLAILIMAIFVIPAARAVPLVMAGQRELETQYQLSLIAGENLESALQSLDKSFVSIKESSDLAASGHEGWRSDLVATVQGSGRYAVVYSVAWVDENGDGLRGIDEAQVRFDTIAANLNWSP